MLVYLALGAVAVSAFGGTLAAPGNFFTGVRRVLGPLMVLVGLAMVGVLRPRVTLGTRLAGRLEERARGGAARWARSSWVWPSAWRSARRSSCSTSA
ncbi:hypothetical protein [Deinococcus metallilatus]|uniref:hypothetical protein n=1 Tax=Deinococcus metallilatus TaxID=1211322 RepID=UPI003CC80FFF